MKKSIFDNKLNLIKGNWSDLFSASLGSVMLSQNRCNDYVVKNQAWEADLNKGILTFGDDEYPIQYLGNEAVPAGTWLWAWQNVNRFPEEILRIAKEIREYGSANSIKELKGASLVQNNNYNGYTLAIVSCALTKEEVCFYRAPYEGGVYILLFSNVPEEVFAPVTAQEFVNVAMDCVKQASIQHKIFIESFLSQNDISYDWDENTIIAHFENDIKIEFEKTGMFFGKTMRVKSINGEL